ncbi:hypothetical protein R1A27_33660 (plasmid) [Methylobacterium sp. NMS12]|uniref:hypothetical protein n=1 Tax=Methylobacterium sp. NMS12 TaxID=3079766 RepID=UPI003F880ADF
MAGIVQASVAVPPTLDEALNAVDDATMAADRNLGSWLTMARTATELRDFAGQIGSVFIPALVTRRRMTEDEIGQYNRLSGYVDAQMRQILLARGKIGDDTRVSMSSCGPCGLAMSRAARNWPPTSWRRTRPAGRLP